MKNFPLLHFEILIILYLTGFAFISIFVPKNLKKITLWFAPLYGTILIALLGTASSFGRLSMNQGIYLINFIVLFLFLYALFTRKFAFIFSKNTLLIWLFLFFLSPFFSLSWDNDDLFCGTFETRCEHYRSNFTKCLSYCFFSFGFYFNQASHYNDKINFTRIILFTIKVFSTDVSILSLRVNLFINDYFSS